MQADLAEGDFSERLANFAYDIEKDGVWNDSVTATAVADWASAVSLSTYYSAIRNNIKGWKISDIIPDFEKSMDKFWWENYGLGDCDKEREACASFIKMSEPWFHLSTHLAEFEDPNHECLGCAMCATRCPDIAITEVHRG